MTMEAFDVFSIFMAGFTVGLIGAHYLNRWELKREYERGVLDALWEIWRKSAIDDLNRRIKSSGDKTTGGEASGRTPV